MSKEDNLVPFSAMSRERHRELSAKGGRASGAARRAKRDRIRQAVEEQLASERASEMQIREMCGQIRALQSLTREVKTMYGIPKRWH